MRKLIAGASTLTDTRHVLMYESRHVRYVTIDVLRHVRLLLRRGGNLGIRIINIRDRFCNAD
ncbi:Uncharacterised protein [Vibrio cholerae]|nr:Uncharacterised protein [Vibrio cholerae]